MTERVAPTVHETVVDGLTCVIEYHPYSSEPVAPKERALAYVSLFVEGCCVQTIQGAMSLNSLIRDTNWSEYIESARRRGWFDKATIARDAAEEHMRHHAKLRLLDRRRSLA